MKKIAFLIICLISIFASCNRKCVCTEKACSCPEMFLELRTNQGDNVNNAYSEEELDQFYLVRTSLSYEKIDSIKINFSTNSGSDNYNRFFFMTENEFGEEIDFRKFNFLVKNHAVNSVDTISSINYTVQKERVLCNTCTNCEDEYIECDQYSNYSLMFNGQEQDSAIVTLEK